MKFAGTRSTAPRAVRVHPMTTTYGAKAERAGQRPGDERDGDEHERPQRREEVDAGRADVEEFLRRIDHDGEGDPDGVLHRGHRREDDQRPPADRVDVSAGGAGQQGLALLAQRGRLGGEAERVAQRGPKGRAAGGHRRRPGSG